MRLLNKTSALACVPAGAAEACACLGEAAARLRKNWLRTIGAPDYRAYLAHHAARHPGTLPMSERDYVAAFIDRRYGGGTARCC